MYVCMYVCIYNTFDVIKQKIYRSAGEQNVFGSVCVCVRARVYTHTHTHTRGQTNRIPRM